MTKGVDASDYTTRLMIALHSGRLPLEVGVNYITVSHEDDCPGHSGGSQCSCQPDVYMSLPDGSRLYVREDGSVISDRPPSSWRVQ